jgi:NAD(P)-dependent dehydrogenase (short-subunit alcohol dehydrogenase family)
MIARTGYNMPVSDISIPEAKALFDLNVWSYIAVTQAFLPLLLNAARRSSAPTLILNNTSVSSIEPTPHNSAYHASKVAAAMFSTHMRIELQPFHIHVVDLKTGCVHSKFHANHQEGKASLPEGSIYAVDAKVKEMTEAAMRGAFPDREDPEVWARNVVSDIMSSWEKKGWLGGSALPLEIWRGTGAWRTWFYNCTVWPVGWWDEWWRKAVGLDLLREKLRGVYGA